MKPRLGVSVLVMPALAGGLALAAGCSSAPQAGQSATPAVQRSQGPASRSTNPQPASPQSANSAGSVAGSSSCRDRAHQTGGSSTRVLSAVQFMSASQGWVVGSDRILHTGDGGRHWSLQFLTKSAAQLDTVDFVDARHGWVAGASELLATSDGGAHWRALAKPCPAIRSMHFVNAA